MHYIQFIHFLIQNGINRNNDYPNYDTGKLIGTTILRSIIYIIYIIPVTIFTYPVFQLVFFHTNLVF